MYTTLGLLSGTRGGVFVGDSVILTTFTLSTDFCLTGNGGGVVELDVAYTNMTVNHET